MRRADRLFQIIQLLRTRRRAVTARWLADELRVSERTVYRDIRDLVGAGTPIAGEAGVGYSLRAGYDLPPLMFDAEEIAALGLGARIVENFGDEELARAASRVLSKVDAVLPARLRPKLEDDTLFVPRTHIGRINSAALFASRVALAEHRKLRFAYERLDGEASERVVRPLGAAFWGRSWTLSAWCELREDFRNFRLDRMRAVTVLEETFVEEEGRTMEDFMRALADEERSEP